MAITTASERAFRTTVNKMGSMLDQMHKGYFGFSPSDTWSPAVNLYETDTAYLICVDLAGVEKDKIDVRIEGGRLSIKGARATPMHPDGTMRAEGGSRRVRVHLMEIDHGSFCRWVDVPGDVRRGEINAIYRDGLLWIELPREPAGETRRGDAGL